jgi:hypothetical protein
MKLTTHLQLVPRSRKYGSIHPLPLRLHGVVFNYLSKGTTLPFYIRPPTFSSDYSAHQHSPYSPWHYPLLTCVLSLWARPPSLSSRHFQSKLLDVKYLIYICFLILFLIFRATTFQPPNYFTSFKSNKIYQPWFQLITHSKHYHCLPAT